MSWKAFVLQSIALVLLTWLAGQYFAGQQGSGLEDVQEQLAAETARLHALERRVRKLAILPPAAAVEVQAAQLESGDALILRIETLEAKEQDLRKKLAGLLNKQRLATQSSQPEHLRVRDWMAGLDAEKRAEAQAAYREELERMQSAFPAAPDAPPPSPAAMHRLLEESRERLKLRLQSILSGEDYQAFLNSLAEGGIPLGLPPLD
ncbi:MAG: hypothetical protein ACTFAL_15910 [Candidatus Electronema sp. V4]|uniref:hypothetical protein n=1 Tax=Candidatus Electronema sp. V4 TaxID=3454756 RepID=UPI0040556BF1